ncbi:MAG: ethylbenzene dehydrogenase-related protein [Phycisphaerales bacterium]
MLRGRFPLPLIAASLCLGVIAAATLAVVNTRSVADSGVVATTISTGLHDRSPAAAIDAAEIFANHCATCHGETGRGDGPASYLLYPKPRDFAAGIYRFKSTHGMAPPTRDDLHRVISDGVPRTAMPGFDAVLTEAEIDSLIDYVRAFNPDDATREAPPIRIPPRPEFTDELVAQGRRVYTTMGCAACHGETGRGDGPSSFDLADADGFPLPPADFTTGVFKAGATPEDRYRSILIGAPGTPMPSFQSAIDASIEVEGVGSDVDMVWAMVAYLDHLVEQKNRNPIRSGASLRAWRGEFDPAMLDDPLHPEWASLEPTFVSVQPLWQRRHAARGVDVRAAVIGDSVVLCLEWDDSTLDAYETVDRATDAVAVMFSLTSAIPTLTMGIQATAEKQSSSVVNMWHWKASRQLDADEHRRHDLAIEGAGAPSDLYMFKTGDPVHGPLTEHDRSFITAWDAGNPAANPESSTRVCEESNAAGFGSLTVQSPEHQNVKGRGVWSEGRWRVVMRRPFDSRGDDAALDGADRVPVAFAVWDGARLDRNGTKLISGWHWLVVD